MHSVTINPVLNGYIVAVGCSTVVFDDRGKLLASLADYLANPDETEKLFMSTGINRGLLHPAAPAACAPAYIPALTGPGASGADAVGWRYTVSSDAPASPPPHPYPQTITTANGPAPVAAVPTPPRRRGRPAGRR